MAKITIIGSFFMDNVAKMDRFPEAGETIIGKDLSLFPGGKGVNQCVAAARLGGDVEMVGMLGKDANGETFRNLLKTDGIKADNVFSCDIPTGIAQIQIDKTGQNRICVIPLANFAFGMEEVEKIDGVLRNTQIVVLQYELKLAIVEEIIKRAHGYGVKVLVNPAPAAKIDENALKLVDYLTPNETELSLITGMKTDTDEQVVSAAQLLIEKGVKNVVATLGSRGALIANKDGAKIVKGFKVDNVVDTVAAGDSFNGALAVAITEGKTLEESVRFANAMGALTVQKEGAIPSLHTRKDVENFLEKNGD